MRGGGEQTASADFLIKLNEERKERKEEPVVALILNLIKRPKEVKIEKSSVLAFSSLIRVLVGVSSWCTQAEQQFALPLYIVPVKHLLDFLWRSFKHLAPSDRQVQRQNR